MKKTNKNKKAWGGRFKGSTDKLAEEFNASIGFDVKLAPYDILGSIAHAEVLKKAGILNATETKKITTALRKTGKEIAAGKFRLSASAEDIHMAIEARLIKLVGPLGGKLHTGRSRNDQVALDLRLYLLEEGEEVLGLLEGLKRVFVGLAEKHIDAIMPGYTHLQRAQPVLFSHHMLAYFEMLSRDYSRIEDALDRADSMPLGAGALAGSPYKLDRKLAARLLGFSAIAENSLDAVSDRDFCLEFTSAASILMTHLSRLSEELILWSSSEFGFIEFSDAFSTGSSIMPQKKNPDIAELTRGKSGRVYGNLTTLLTIMKGLPLAYNKDMQEDKEPLFDTVDTLKAVLAVTAPMLKKMKVNKKQMLCATREGFLTATDAADFLASEGMPFRESHRVVGEAVAFCVKENKTLEELTLKEWKGFSELFTARIKRIVSVEHSVSSRRVRGGTAPALVARRIAEIKAGF